jgi:hypothetical protein
MNQISPVPTSGAVVIRTPLSAPLSRAVKSVLEPHPDLGMPSVFPALVRAEAAAAASELERQCRPVTAERLQRWIQPVGAIVSNAPAPQSDDYRAWIAAAMTAFSETSAGSFNAETQRAALLKFKWWPTAAEISSIVGPKGVALRAELAALWRIARAEPPAADGLPDKGEDAQAYVKALVSGFVSERSFMQPSNSPASKAVNAAPLSPGALMAAWARLAAEGVPGAADRVAMLQRQVVG